MYFALASKNNEALREFIWQVVYNLNMPQFSDTILLLMRIGSSTYAGVKLTQK